MYYSYEDEEELEWARLGYACFKIKTKDPGFSISYVSITCAAGLKWQDLDGSGGTNLDAAYDDQSFSYPYKGRIYYNLFGSHGLNGDMLGSGFNHYYNIDGGLGGFTCTFYFKYKWRSDPWKTKTKVIAEGSAFEIGPGDFGGR